MFLENLSQRWIRGKTKILKKGDFQPVCYNNADYHKKGDFLHKTFTFDKKYDNLNLKKDFLRC